MYEHKFSFHMSKIMFLCACLSTFFSEMPSLLPIFQIGILLLSLQSSLYILDKSP